MQWIAAFLALVQIFSWSAPVAAQNGAAHRTVITTSWVEEWDPALQRWVRVDDVDAITETRAPSVSNRPNTTHHFNAANRYASEGGRNPVVAALAQYGPFVVMDNQRAAMVGATDSASPACFDAMLRDYPGLTMLEMIEAPGTSNDIANLAIGRRIREEGLATHVPRGGSVRSGAVELFLAGSRRSVEPGAQFAVHSWLDNHGREPRDFAPDDPANRLYLDYYMEMGMSEGRARAFYAMTNSVPHHSALWLGGDEMMRWIRPEGPLRVASVPVASQTPFIGYVDLSGDALAGTGHALAKPFLDS